MKRRALAALGTIVLGAPALAGGLFLPGSGAVSTSRAGAGVVSADDGEALSLNPAGIAKSRGTTITVAASLIQYFMEFTRRGTYDAIADVDRPYEGQPYATVKNDPELSLGFAGLQPIPVVAIVSDLGGAVPNLRVAAGVYAPNAYPFRDMTDGYVFNASPDAPPPPTRYDIMKQSATVLMPSLAASYRVLPALDVGVRLSAGFAHIESQVAIWGFPGNVVEDITKDGVIGVDARDNFIPAFGLGATYRPTPALELGASFSSAIVIHAKGDAVSENGPAVSLNGTSFTVGPTPDEAVRCAPGGTFEEQKACVDLQLPMTLTLGGRYKLLDANGHSRGDLELDLGWENWGKRCDFVKDVTCTSPAQYRVVIDASVFVEGVRTLALNDSVLDHRLKDTFSARLGGSYHIPLGAAPAEPTEGDTRNQVILRGGVGFDTRAAEEGWLRADFDGAARVYTTAGGAFRTRRFEVNLGAGYVFEGSPSNDGTCNPTEGQRGCAGGTSENPPDERQGPDPVNPLARPDQQIESPVAQGEYKSSYLLLMLGFKTWF